MGLYNNYYFFCKSIPLSGIFIHLNLYNIMKRTIKTIFLALCYSAVTNGQTSTPIHLPAIFSDHMVLQLQPVGYHVQPACIWAAN